MNKISKKYIGTDQVGSVQLELENALSLRAKAFDGISSVDLLEYTADDQLVVQQSLFMIESANIKSLNSSGAFEIGTQNPVDMNLIIGQAFDEGVSGGSLNLYAGNSSSGAGGNLILNAGGGTQGGIVQIYAGSSTGENNGGSFTLVTGGSDNGDSGFILLETAVPIGTGTRGGIELKAKRLDVGVEADPIESITFNMGSVGDVANFGWTYALSTVGMASTKDLIFGTSAVTDAINSALLRIESGSVVDGVSGNVNISTGTASGTGSRGIISLDATYVDCNAMNLKDIADPVDPQDAATKAYVDQQIAAGTDFHKEQITLDATDISNQYVDLEFECIPQSVMIGVGQRVNLYEGSDFTVVADGGTGGVARITFAGPSATGGAEALVDGDILFISFVKA